MQTPYNRPRPSAPAPPTLQFNETLTEIRRCREDVGKVNEDLKRLARSVDALVRNQKELQDCINQLATDNFTIEKSIYKVPCIAG